MVSRQRGEATLMMEDNWPATGDYDFNDFVIGYRTQATFFDGHGGSKEDYEQDGLEIKITFRAMGGYLPYRLGLQLDKTHARYIDDVIEIEGNDLVKMEPSESRRRCARHLYLYRNRTIKKAEQWRNIL